MMIHRQNAPSCYHYIRFYHTISLLPPSLSLSLCLSLSLASFEYAVQALQARHLHDGTIRRPPRRGSQPPPLHRAQDRMTDHMLFPSLELHTPIIQ